MSGLLSHSAHTHRCTSILVPSRRSRTRAVQEGSEPGSLKVDCPRTMCLSRYIGLLLRLRIGKADNNLLSNRLASSAYSCPISIRRLTVSPMVGDAVCGAYLAANANMDKSKSFVTVCIGSRLRPVSRGSTVLKAEERLSGLESRELKLSKLLTVHYIT